MANIDIVTQDELLILLRKKAKQGLVSNMPLNNQDVSDGISYRLLVHSVEEEIESTFNTLGNSNMVNFCFSMDTDSKVYINQQTNYNSAESYSPTQRKPELSLRSVYDMDSSELNTVSTNAANQIYTNIPIQFGESNIGPTDKISLRESFDNSPVIENKESFPFYVSFNFVNTPNNFYNFLNSYGVYELMVETFHKLSFVPESYRTTSGGVTIPTLGLQDVIENLTTTPNDFQLKHYPKFVNSELWGEEFDQLDGMVFISHLNKYINNNATNYMQAINQENRPHVETICYEIIKYRGDSSVPLQTFYIPATDSNRFFIDNQINFGDTYTYQVNLIGAVLYNQYQYSTVVSDNRAKIEVMDSKVIKFVKLSLDNSARTIKGIAPTKPEIQFLNESNSDKKMRIYFEPDTHTVAEGFISIMDTDTTEQGNALLDSDRKIKYKLNKDFLTFQIFKLTKKPMSYLDFSNSLITEVTGKDRSSSEVYTMNLTPNMKHYFTFRTKNNFNLFSNPTPIYEVELIRDSDETRIVSNIVHLKEHGDDREREFGRFLRIYPAFEQLLLREFDSGQNVSGENVIRFNNKQFYLGTTEDPIWGKKFKFRIRSKNTGKILDLNVDFVIKKEDSEKDF